MAKYYSVGLLVAILLACHAAPTGNFANNSKMFSFNLYQTLAASTSGNIVFSPFSIQTALALAYMGADGTTAAEMAQGLHFEDDVNVVADNHKSLFDRYSQTGAVKIANKIYLHHTFYVKPTFMQLATDKFYSTAEKIDTSNGGQAARIINSWVESQTNNKIKNLVEPSDIQGSPAVLVNAVYLKRKWRSEFKKAKTTEKPFWLSETRSKNVQMMSQDNVFLYSKYDDFQVLKMDYVDVDLGLLIILPKEREGLRELEQRFLVPESDIMILLGALVHQRVHVELPKFKIEYDARLKPALEQMGMGTMFTQHADFRKLTPASISISDVIHKAVIEVDEKGTEASASTAVTTMLGGPSIRSRNRFIADHPFIYLLLDSSGHIFFMGRYVN